VLAEQLQSEVTSIIVHDTYAALGTRDGLIYLWNLAFGRCEFCLSRAARKRSETTPVGCCPREAITKLIIVMEFVVSLNEDHQMCIWNREKGQLIKEFTFFAPKQLTKQSLFNFVPSDLLSALTSMFSVRRARASLLSELWNVQPAPTMCLYSKNLLITSGCSCIFIWNISSGGELVKKINLIKPVNINSPLKSKSTVNQDNSIKNKYSQKFYVKKIHLVVQRSFEKQTRCGKGSPKMLKNKVLLITDYTDTMYVLKIPSYIFQELD
jgi:hypothetical protein